MPRQLTKKIIEALKRAGVTIESDDLEKVEGKLDAIELRADELIGEDEKVISISEYREIKDDLTKLRKERKEFKETAEELRKLLDSGDSDNARKAETYKKKLDEQQPLIDELMESNREAWAAVEKNIPDKLKPSFKFPKDGESLSDSDLVANVRKLREYERIGAFATSSEDGDGAGRGDGEGEGEGKRLDTSARLAAGKKGGLKLSKEELSTMPAIEKIEKGYVYKE